MHGSAVRQSARGCLGHVRLYRREGEQSDVQSRYPPEEPATPSRSRSSSIHPGSPTPTLLDVFWHNTDPTVIDRQFCDIGSQYRTAIFYHSEEQRLSALKSKEALEKTKPFKEPIVTEVTKAGEFYPAEEYHQHYYKKNPIRYKYYRSGCGRDRRLKELWGDTAGH